MGAKDLKTEEPHTPRNLALKLKSGSVVGRRLTDDETKDRNLVGKCDCLYVLSQSYLVRADMGEVFI